MPWHELTGMGGVKETISRRELNERFSQESQTPEIDPPEDGEHIWDWFWSLSERRQQGMNGPQPLSYEGISIWSKMTGTLLLREELDILVRMDTAFVRAIAEEQQDQSKRRDAKDGARKATP